MSARKPGSTLERHRRQLVRRDALQLDLLLAMLVDDIDVAWPGIHWAPEHGTAGDGVTRDHVGDLRTAALDLRAAIARMVARM